jgi:hypothetical protein
MGTGETVSKTPGSVAFRGVLALVAVVYVGGLLASGQLFMQLPTNWFVTWLSGIFSLMDSSGFFNVWSGLGHGAHYLYFLLWKPAQAISGGVWDLAMVFSLLWFVVTITATFVSAYLFYKIALRVWGDPKATILATVYIVLFLTFEWYTVVDSIAIAAFLGAIYCALKGSGKLGGVFLAVSTVMKPIGLVVLPVLIRSQFLSRKTRITFVATFSASVAGLLLPFAVGNAAIFMSPLHWQSGRPPWETVYSFVMWLQGRPLPGGPFFQDYSGIAPRDWGWTGITPPLSIMTTSVPGSTPWYSLLSIMLLALALLGFLLFKTVRSEKDMLWGSLYAVGAYFVVFYGWSVQFLYWLAPFLLLLFPLAVTIVFKIIGWLEYPVLYGLYLARVAPDLVASVVGMPASWTELLSVVGSGGFWSVIMLRTALILGLSVIAWNKLPIQFWDPISRPVRIPPRA